MTARDTYRIDADALTVIRNDGTEDYDLNAEGAPCATVEDLRWFIRALAEQGAFGEDVRDELLGEVPRLRAMRRRRERAEGLPPRKAGRPAKRGGANQTRSVSMPPDVWAWVDAQAGECEMDRSPWLSRLLRAMM